MSTLLQRHGVADHGDNVRGAAVVARMEEFDRLARRATEVLNDVVELLEGVADDATSRAALPRSAARELAVASTRFAQCAERASVHAVAAITNSRAHLDDALSTPARWAQLHLGVSRSDAYRLCRAAKVVDRLEHVRAAFDRGDMRLAHLDAIARIVPARWSGADEAAAWQLLGECQLELVNWASAADPSRFETGCGVIRDRLDADGPPDRSAEPSQLWLTRVFDGRWSLSGDLSADDGAMLAAFLERRTRAELRRATPNHTGTNDTAASGNTTPIAEVRAQALLSLCGDGAGSNKPGRIAAHLHIDLDNLSTHEPALRPAHTETGHDVTAETLWALLADADVTPYFTRNGRTLSYGTTRRLAPETLRRVLAHRDRTCRFPGCDAPPIWHDAHHVQHVADDGETDPDNMLGLCRFHHILHHSGGWDLDYDATFDEVVVNNPDGGRHHVDQHWQSRQRRTDPIRHEILQRLGVDRRLP